MRFFLIAFSFFISIEVYSQEEQDYFVYDSVEVKPQFPGGVNELYKYVVKNLRYPSFALKKHIEGRVFVKFLIDASGLVIKESITIEKGVHESLDNEAIRIIKESPNWIPGYKYLNGEPVKVQMILPIVFKLGR